MGGSELKLRELLGSMNLLDLICSKFNHEYNFRFLLLLPHAKYDTHMMIHFKYY
jgi:hypothetical protein